MQETNESKSEFDAKLLRQFQGLRLAADYAIEAHEVGFYDKDYLLEMIDRLRAKDNTGVEWKPGYAVDEWYKLEDGEWVADFPPFPRHLLTNPDEYLRDEPFIIESMWKMPRKRRSEENTRD